MPVELLLAGIVPTLPGLTAASALEGEQVGVVAVAPQAEVRPPDGVSLARVENELSLSELHDPRAQLVALIVHVDNLEQRVAAFTTLRCQALIVDAILLLHGPHRK